MGSVACEIRSFNDDLLEKGKEFRILFYVILSVYFLPQLAVTLLLLLKLSVLKAFFSLFWTAVMLYLLKKRAFYGALILSLFMSPLYLMLVLLPVVNLFILSSNLGIYCFIGVSSLVFGLVYSFLFNKTSDKCSMLIIPGFFCSIVVSVIFAISKMTAVLLEDLADTFSQLENSMAPSSMFQGNASSALFGVQPLCDATVGFILFYVFFNAPFIKYFLEREDKNYGCLLLYIIPPVCFVGVYYLLKMSLGTSLVGM